MIFNFTCPVQILDGNRLRTIAEIEARAHLAPNADDPSEWLPVAFEVADVTSDAWIVVRSESAWYGMLHSQVLDGATRLQIDSEWTAHRNAEGDAALYGQEA
jgi:hypothetical protein